MEIVVVLMVLVAAGLFILRPVISGGEQFSPAPRQEDDDLRAALARREQVYESLADLEMDHVAGKISDPEHSRLKRLHQTEAIAAIKSIETLRESSQEEKRARPGRSAS